MRAICLMGPTAAGKTEVALELARHYPVEIISVDSAQIYRGLNIGAAKPAAEILAEFPHRLIDRLEPHETYSAGQFCRDAVEAMRDITATERIPLLVGGTMLYFQALQQGLADLPTADPDLRRQIDARAAREGWPALHADLARIDPRTAERLRPTDAQRIQRALEVCAVAGEPMSSLLDSTRPPIEADYLNIGLIPGDRARLHRRIADRFATMLDEGLVAEVAGLLARPDMSSAVPSMRAVGYRQIAAQLAGELTPAEAADKAVVATRRLAKRQLTWLRGWPGLIEVDPLTTNAVARVTEIVDSWRTNGATAKISR